jgi:hypothetical protein
MSFKKGRISKKGLRNYLSLVMQIQPSTIVLAISHLRNPDTAEDKRVGAIRVLAAVCARSLRHHLSDPEIYQNVVDTLRYTLNDKNPDIRSTAQQGLDMLQRNEI